MSATNDYRFIARVVIEFLTPFHVGAGREGDVADAEIVRDVNGLPAIPGSSLAGVLRSAVREQHGDDLARKLFGYQDPASFSAASAQAGRGSAIAVSWACLHDSQNVPVEGMVDAARLRDAVLSALAAPSLRDHVRLNHRGVSDREQRGKFDELVACAGARFTFELEMAGTQGDKAAWAAVLETLTDSSLRLGGKSRRGLGAFRIVELWTRVFSLLRSEDADAYVRHPVRLAEPSPSLEKQLRVSESKKIKTTLMQLRPRGYWMFGGGVDIEGGADMAPVRDRRIIWDESGQASVQPDLLVIPGSAIKGAISHRVAFHFNALTQTYADRRDPEEHGKYVGIENPAVRELFGFCKDDDETGQRGRVFIDDLFVENLPQSQFLNHVSIDRFTGGARAGLLFSERALWQGWTLAVRISVVDPDTISDQTRQALLGALSDLACGRLSLGAGSGRGHGFFESTAWSPPEWLEKGAEK